MEQRLSAIFEDARLDLGLSQAAVAARAARLGYDMTQVQVSRVLRGEVSMKVNDAEALARALGMTFAGAIRLAEQDVVTARSEVIDEPGTDPKASAARRRKPRPVTGRRQAT